MFPSYLKKYKRPTVQSKKVEELQSSDTVLLVEDLLFVHFWLSSDNIAFSPDELLFELLPMYTEINVEVMMQKMSLVS